jgi:hypothetical protein
MGVLFDDGELDGERDELEDEDELEEEDELEDELELNPSTAGETVLAIFCRERRFNPISSTS